MPTSLALTNERSDSEILTKKECAELLKVTPRYIERAVMAGRLVVEGQDASVACLDYCAPPELGGANARR